MKRFFLITTFVAIVAMTLLSGKPSLLERMSQPLQIFALRHTILGIPLVKYIMPYIRLVERIHIAKSTTHEYVHRKRLQFGPNFAAHGRLWLSDFDQVEKDLTSPAAKSTLLGAMSLEPKKLPQADGRMTFLVTMSDEGAGGNGNREAFRKALMDYLIHTPDLQTRRHDATSKTLLSQLVNDYTTMDREEFFNDNKHGLKGYLCKVFHYIIFGIDPNDSAAIDTLTKFHYESQSAAYYLKGYGGLFEMLKFNDWPKQVKDVAKIYETSPALSKYADPAPLAKYNFFTRDEFANMMVAIMSIAVMVGPVTLLYQAMGFHPLPTYEGHETHDIDVTKVWKNLDFDDKNEVINYLTEVGRLKLPVATTHRVATDRFTVDIQGKKKSFPKGTEIVIPMSLAMIDENFWGSSAFEFDHKRKNLCPYSMMFNSVGDRHAGRECPGKALSLDLLSEIMVELGKKN